jgi:hypothetical protein
MHRALSAVALLSLIGAGCGGKDERTAVERPASPVWCPSRLKLEGHQAAHGNFDARHVIGLAADKAKDLAHAHGCELRVTSIDGKAQQVAAIGSRRFINVQIEKDVVVRFDSRFGPIG